MTLRNTQAVDSSARNASGTRESICSLEQSKSHIRRLCGGPGGALGSFLLAIAVVGGPAGCSDQPPPSSSGDSVARTDRPATADPRPPGPGPRPGESDSPIKSSDAARASAGTGEGSASAEPHPAAAAARTLLHAWSQGRLSEVFASLPPRWQRDVQDVVHRAARSVDPELLHQLQRFFSLAERLWNERRDEVLAAQLASKTGLTGWPPQAHQRLGRVLDLLARCDLWDAERLAELNVSEFLKSQGDALAGALLDFLRSVPGAAAPLQDIEKPRITVASLARDRARVLIEFPRRPPIDTVYVRIDGRWLPQGIADRWPAWIATASRWLDEQGRGDVAASTPPDAERSATAAAGVHETSTNLAIPSSGRPPSLPPATRLKALNDDLERLLEAEPGEAFQERLAEMVRRYWPVRPTSDSTEFPPETEEILPVPPQPSGGGVPP